jgi:hypothetical protein
MNDLMSQALKPFAPKPSPATTHDLEQRLRNHATAPGINSFLRDDLTAAADRLVALDAATHKTSRQLAEDDSLRFGAGFVQRHPDGREEHIPLDQVAIHGDAISVKSPS